MAEHNKVMSLTKVDHVARSSSRWYRPLSLLVRQDAYVCHSRAAVVERIKGRK